MKKAIVTRASDYRTVPMESVDGPQVSVADAERSVTAAAHDTGADAGGLVIGERDDATHVKFAADVAGVLDGVVGFARA